MKKMKIAIVIATILSILVLALLIMTGGKRYDVFMTHYEVKEESITVYVMPSGSYGYLRSIGQVESDDESKVYVNFNSTFGIHNALNAKNEFNISFPEECKEIYFEVAPNKYELIFKRSSLRDEWKVVETNY